MNGIFLLIPTLLIRYGLLFLINKTAMRRAAHFAPMAGGEKVAYWIYQLSTIAILVYVFFLRVQTAPAWPLYAGLAVYGVGIVLCAAAVINFAHPSASGINCTGLYRISRNPMYMAYLVCFLGCVLLTHSLVLLGLVLVFQVSAHWIILAEERWCLCEFAGEYLQYMQNVRRYI